MAEPETGSMTDDAQLTLEDCAAPRDPDIQTVPPDPVSVEGPRSSQISGPLPGNSWADIFTAQDAA